ncbi:MAG: hypothetical protein U0869_15450 [Chloroflexota bacterium]
MTPRMDLEDRLAQHLHAEAPARAPDRVLLGALESIEQTPQRRWLPAPRKDRPMFTLLRLGLVAALAGLATAMLLVLSPASRPSNDLVASGSPAASPAPVASPGPRSTMRLFTLKDTSAWLRWTSPVLGYAMRFPADWNVEPSGTGEPGDTADHFTSNDPAIGFSVDAERLSPGVSFADWVAQYSADGVAGNGQYGPPCWGKPEAWRSITVGGVEALVHGGPAQCYFIEAVANAGDVVYHLTGTRVDPQNGFDATLFESFLSTVTFQPDALALAPDSPAP